MKEKKLLFKVLFVLAILLSTSVFAISKGPCDTNDVCCEQPAAGPFAFAYPKDLGLACPRDFNVYAEFLLMKPSEDGLEYAMDQDSSGASNIFPLVNGSVKGFSRGSDEWDWRYGVRAGFGFSGMSDAWNVSVDWTYIKIKSDSESSNEGTGFLLPLFYPARGVANDFISMQNASSRWSGDYSTMDLMIGKPYHVSRYYISNPMFGIRAGWIDQDYHVRYFQGNSSKRNVFLKNDYWGAGLRGAYEVKFLLGSGCYIYGKMAFA